MGNSTKSAKPVKRYVLRFTQRLTAFRDTRCIGGRNKHGRTCIRGNCDVEMEAIAVDSPVAVF